jgi:hypothetical protein
MSSRGLGNVQANLVFPVPLVPYTQNFSLPTLLDFTGAMRLITPVDFCIPFVEVIGIVAGGLVCVGLGGIVFSLFGSVIQKTALTTSSMKNRIGTALLAGGFIESRHYFSPI